VLALEVATSRWSANSSAGGTPADPRDEHYQSAVGSATDPWRAAQARHRDRTDKRGQIYGQAKKPAVPRMEDVPPQSCRRHRRYGYVRGADNLVPSALWFVDHGHGRRQVIWCGVTTHPTAEWIANQITEACGWEQLPRYLIRDRDGAYGEVFIRR